MKDKMVISLDLKFEDNEEPKAHYKIRSYFNKDMNSIPMLRSVPWLLEGLFDRLECGSRCLVDNGYIQLERMRQILEETTDSSIEVIDRIRKMVAGPESN